MTKVTYGPYCECGDDYKDHDETGCKMIHGGMGPSDNMDVWEERCECTLPRLYTLAELEEAVRQATAPQW